MEIVKILVATLAGTSTMTAFSYIVSEAFQKLFKEPVLLAIIMKKLRVDASAKTKTVLAWLLHYFIGLLFVLSYELAWNYFNIPQSWLVGCIFGCISGIIGILGWMLIFRIPGKPPNVHFSEYYLQLFFAHVVFALTVRAVYKIFEP
ncbi:MAG: hypothetical protein EOO51_09525 [Flavobacterium sp.]|nr:MAG: hypothetical protein EOO51_09525 [Flavobacterium sp.]